MNEKTITFIDPTTGEILTGTNRELADQLGINEKTLWKRRQKEVQVLPSNEVLPKKETSQVLPVAEVEVLPQVLPSSVSTVTFEENENYMPEKEDFTSSSIKTNRYVPEGAIVTNDGRILLAKGSCLKCGQIVYHRVNGQYICFNLCTKAKKKVNMGNRSKERAETSMIMKETADQDV